MTRLSSLELAAAVGGTVALSKVLALAVALAMLAVGAADAGSLGRACTTPPEPQRTSSDALRPKAAAPAYPLRSGKVKKACVLQDAGQGRSDRWSRGRRAVVA